jgi:hypothetical protein
MLDDTITEYNRMKQIFPYCKYEDLFSKKDLQNVYTNEMLSNFLNVSINTKTNIYTILNRIRLYINNNNLCDNGVINPDDKLMANLVVSLKHPDYHIHLS